MKVSTKHLGQRQTPRISAMDFFAAGGLHPAASGLYSIIINWLKQGMDALELWVDRGDGKGFVFLAIDSIPDYTDTAAMPPAGQSALWKYKGIYIQADQRVGQWSDVVSIPVAG